MDGRRTGKVSCTGVKMGTPFKQIVLKMFVKKLCLNVIGKMTSVNKNCVCYFLNNLRSRFLTSIHKM